MKKKIGLCKPLQFSVPLMHVPNTKAKSSGCFHGLPMRFKFRQYFLLYIPSISVLHNSLGTKVQIPS